MKRSPGDRLHGIRILHEDPDVIAGEGLCDVFDLFFNHCLRMISFLFI